MINFFKTKTTFTYKGKQQTVDLTTTLIALSDVIDNYFKQVPDAYGVYIDADYQNSPSVSTHLIVTSGNQFITIVTSLVKAVTDLPSELIGIRIKPYNKASKPLNIEIAFSGADEPDLAFTILGLNVNNTYIPGDFTDETLEGWGL